METSNEYLEQINEILSLLKEQSKRKAVLELLLGFSDNEEMRKVFLKTDIAKIMIRQLESEDTTDRDLILQIMINLSCEEIFQAKFIELNAIYRITHLLMQKIDKEVLKDDGEKKDNFDIATLSTKNDVDMKLIFDKYVINSETIKKNSTGGFQEVPYYFMILTNLTISEAGQKKFLNVEDEKITGIIFMKVLDKFFQYIYNEEFNFCSSLFANISSLKVGRELILEHKIFKIFLIHFDKMNNFKIVNLLRIIRNCCFEFETYKDDLLINDAILFSYLIKILVLTNITEKKELLDIGIFHIDNIYFPHFNQEAAQLDKETINDLVIDIFLVLTNIEEAISLMKSKDLYKAIKQIGVRIGDSENITNRLFVINNYLEN